MDPQPTSLRNELDLMTEQELAAHLKICRRQLYNWRVGGLIPYFKMGKAVRFRVADVAAAIERMRIGCLNRRSTGKLGNPGVHDLADQVHRDLGDGKHDAAQAFEAQQLLHFPACIAGAVRLETIIEDDVIAAAGDQFECAFHCG